MKGNTSSYMGEALHTSSKYLINRDFDLDFTSMENAASAINKCESQENAVYSFYGASSFSQFMEKIRNNFIQNPQDAIIFSYFQHGNLKRKLGELARAMKVKRKEVITLDYQIDITLEDNASSEFRDAIKKNFPKRTKGDSLGLNLGIAAQKKRIDRIIKTIMAQESKRSKKTLSKAEVYRRLEQGLIEGISFTSDNNHSDTISNAIEVNSKLGHFPWGFYKDEIKLALQQQDGYYYQKLQEAYEELRKFFTITLVQGGSPQIQRAAEIVWEQKLGSQLNISFSFFEKGDVDNLKVGAAGEYQAAMLFTYFDLILNNSSNARDVAQIVGDDFDGGAQGKIDVALLGKYGIQVKNYDTVFRQLSNNSLIHTGTNVGLFSKYMSDVEAQDFRLFFANFYFNKTFAEAKAVEYQRLTKEINNYAYGIYSLALSDAIANDQVNFYLVGGKYLIPASHILKAFGDRKAKIRNPDIKIRGINRLTDEEFEERGLESKYWQQIELSAYTPTELNKQQYNNLVNKSITIKSNIDYMEIMGSLENPLYALF